MTICLNMIVKNESKIITRLFDSVIHIIDCYCICDTGSTDNTVEIINDYFKSKNKSGIVCFKEFVDFGTNRTYALKEAQKINCDYILLLDADMVIKINNFDVSKLKEDVYTILQGNNSFNYYNTRLIKSNLKVTVKCPTHEYYDIEGKTTSGKLPKDVIFIEDIGDGGCKQNKFERDIQLLLKGISLDKNNGRYHFYLANSYHDTGKYEEAIVYYKKLIHIGSWIEEIFYSWFRLGICYQKLNQHEKMIDAWLNGYQALPCRSETLYELIKYYRIKGNNSHLCNIFYQIAKDIPYPAQCSLFIHREIYEYRLLEEYTIFGYYLGLRNLSDEIHTLMKRVPKNEIYKLYNNYKFYQPVLEAETVIHLHDHFPEFERTIFGEKYTFIASSASILSDRNNFYTMNIRFVNYRINPNGSYPWYKHITTINKNVTLNKNFMPVTVKEVELPIEDKHYVGVEDIKLFQFKNQVLYAGTALVGDNLGIVMGDYTLETKNSLFYSDSQGCEKNWVFVPGFDQLTMIYKWDPLTVGTILDHKLVNIRYKEMPQFFSVVRGSTNGYLFNNEIWFIVHMVHQNNEEPRHYYHSIVVFDLELNLKRYTKPFKFTTGQIEYCLGLIVEESRVIITHSVWDRESYIRIYSMEHISTLF